jgi:hypothetical protein
MEPTTVFNRYTTTAQETYLDEFNPVLGVQHEVHEGTRCMKCTRVDMTRLVSPWAAG